MLPDLRIVIVAVLSTFLFTVSVAFYTSSRLMNESPSARSDKFAAKDDSPINRIALNWPEPLQQTTPMDLDFAVTLKASRNPVRDVTDEPVQAQSEVKAAQASAVDTATPDRPQAVAAPAAKDTPAPSEAASEPPAEEPTQQNSDQQSSTAAETSPSVEIASPPSESKENRPEEAAPSVAALPEQTEDIPATTSSITEPVKPSEPADEVARDEPAQPEQSEAGPKVASRPTEAEIQAEPIVRQADTPKQGPASVRVTPSRRASQGPRRAKKVRIVQRRPRPLPATPTTPTFTFNFPFNFLQHSFPN